MSWSFWQFLTNSKACWGVKFRFVLGSGLVYGYGEGALYLYLCEDHFLSIVPTE